MAHDSLYAAPEQEPQAGPPGGAHRRVAVLSALDSWDTVIVLALVLVLVAAGLTVENFATSRNAQFLVLDLIPIALVALPMTLIIITGEIDLSVASTMGLTSAVIGKLWMSTGLPMSSVVVLAVLLGGVLGGVNGVFVTRFGLPSLAVTIGTLALYRGLAFVVLGDQAVADFPTSWTTAAIKALPGTSLPVMAVPVLVLALAFIVVLHATPTGRALYAMGNNESAATFSGVSVARTKQWLFVACGAVSALAGLYWTLRYASARADNAQGLELSVVAAVLLGGVSIFGGRGGLVGVLAGALLLASVRNALQLADVDANALTIVTGALLIASVVVPNLVTNLRAVVRQRRRRTAAGAPG